MMKLAFLFLTQENHNQGGLWEAFFGNNSEICFSIYCHPKYPSRIHQPFLKNNIIPDRIDTEHAGISLVRATLLLLQHAFKDPDNEYFILLSESCIPLYGFRQIYDHFKLSGKSFISYKQDRENKEAAIRWRQLLDPTFISLESFAKQHQWMALRRELVAWILKSDFTSIFENIYAPDEHYFVNLLLKLNLPMESLVINQPVTFANWRDYEAETVTTHDPVKGNYFLQRIRPKTYNELSSIDIVSARKAGCLFFRKVSPICDCSRLLNLIEVMSRFRSLSG